MLWGEFSPHHPLSYTRKALAVAPRAIVADGFAVHPYAGDYSLLPGGLGSIVHLKHAIASWSRRTRKSLATPGGRPLPVYGTEFGCSTRVHDERECARHWSAGLSLDPPKIVDGSAW